MTATVRTAPVSTRKMADADLRARVGYRPDGQLWERVAERTRPDYGVYPWKMLDAVEHFIGGRGPRARQHNGVKLYSGIIRAGERVK